jgi:hypothetical protein
MKTETYPVSETLCFLVFRVPDDGRSPQTQQFLETNAFAFPENHTDRGNREIQSSSLCRDEARNSKTEECDTVLPAKGHRTLRGGGAVTDEYGTAVEGGARGSVVVKALCYKPKGRGFVSR